MFAFHQDYNITEKLYNKPRHKYGKTYLKGEKIRDVKLLHANETTQDWVKQHDFRHGKSQMLFFSHIKYPFKSRENTSVSLKGSINKNEDENFRSNLLSKIPINSTIINNGNLLPSAASPTSTPMNRSFHEDYKPGHPNKLFDMATTTFSGGLSDETEQPVVASNEIKLTKYIYINAIDGFNLIKNRSGFLKTNAINCAAPVNHPILGVYCIRWRRTDDTIENETKLIINPIG